MQQSEQKKFNFDEWMQLAANQPEEFEQRRKAVIEDFISRAPEHHQARLRSMQWRIDQERERSSNPLSACIRLYRMMLRSVYGDNGFISALKMLAGGAATPPLHSAAVLPFKKPETR